MLTLTNKEEITGNKYSFFPTNMGNDASIIGAIYPCEIDFLESLLGTAMYEDMLAIGSGVISNYTTQPISGGAAPPVLKFPANANYELLWSKYLIQFMSIAIMYESLPYIAAQLQTNGLVENNPYGATGLKIKDAKVLQQSHRDNIFKLWYRIEKFLCDNKTDYPLFKTKNCSHYICGDHDCKDEQRKSKTIKGVIFYGLEKQNKRHRCK